MLLCHQPCILFASECSAPYLDVGGAETNKCRSIVASAAGALDRDCRAHMVPALRPPGKAAQTHWNMAPRVAMLLVHRNGCPHRRPSRRVNNGLFWNWRTGTPPPLP